MLNVTRAIYPLAYTTLSCSTHGVDLPTELR